MNRHLLFASLIIAASLIGCGQGQNPTPQPPVQTAEAEHSHAGGHGHEHGEWWCAEHGVPEGICAQCNSKVAAEFQKKGDWCKDHERPDSQCFICHPEKFADFAAKYEAKYGKQPPKPELN